VLARAGSASAATSATSASIKGKRFLITITPKYISGYFYMKKEMRLWRESVWGNPGGLQNVCKDCQICGKGDTA
jgi:hypothetical protein